MKELKGCRVKPEVLLMAYNDFCNQLEDATITLYCNYYELSDDDFMDMKAHVYMPSEMLQMMSELASDLEEELEWQK